jgi:hypothetical protein
MTANVVRVNSNYKIQSIEGGQIILDTGQNPDGSYGTVNVIGNLSVIGEATVITSNVVSIQDVIITLNVGENGNGVTGSISEPHQSGLEIARGTAITGVAKWLWDDSQNWTNPHSNTIQKGMWVSSTASGGLNGIQTNAITTGSTGDNLYLLSSGTSVVSVTGTSSYENQVLDYNNGLVYKDKDIIPNIKAVTDRISYDLTNFSSNFIRRSDSSISIYDSNISEKIVSYNTGGNSVYITLNHFPTSNTSLQITTSSYVTIIGSNSINLNGTWPVITAVASASYFVIQIAVPSSYSDLPWSGNITIQSYNSNVQIILDSSTVASFYVNHINLFDVSIANDTISTVTSGNDLVLQGLGSGAVKINDTLTLTNQSAPSSTANTTKVYSAAHGAGNTGLFFVNTSYSDEFISKKKAIAFSILM